MSSTCLFSSSPPYSLQLLYLSTVFVLDLITCTFTFLLSFFNCAKTFSVWSTYLISITPLPWFSCDSSSSFSTYTSNSWDKYIVFVRLLCFSECIIGVVGTGISLAQHLPEPDCASDWNLEQGVNHSNVWRAALAWNCWQCGGSLSFFLKEW